MLKTYISQDEKKVKESKENTVIQEKVIEQVNKHEDISFIPASAYAHLMAWVCSPFQGDHKDYPKDWRSYIRDMRHYDENIYKYIQNDHVLANLCMMQGSTHCEQAIPWDCVNCLDEKSAIVHHLAMCPKCQAEDFHVRPPEVQGTPYECYRCDHKFKLPHPRKGMSFCTTCKTTRVVTSQDGTHTDVLVDLHV